MQITSHAARKSPSAWRDMRRDWQRWSRGERLAASSVGFATLASAVFYSLSTVIH
jgi:hypothetical protein